MNKAKWIWLSLFMPAVLFNNCSDVSFKESASQAETGEFDAAIDQPPGQVPTTPAPSTPVVSNPPAPTTPQIVPKVRFIGPPCQRLTLCTAEFRLDKAYSLKTEFDWRTNDTLYQTPHVPIYAQPGVHYNSTGGHIVFAPGETSKVIAIQNINAQATEVTIGVKMSNCMYGTYTGTCQSFFQ